MAIYLSLRRAQYSRVLEEIMFMIVLRSGPPPRLDQAFANELALTPTVSWMFNC
jgi:hypothetical protein